MKRRAMNKHKAGMQGQQIAEIFLRNKGYCILAKNYRTRVGEIDLIVRQDSYVVFVEVKARKGLEYGYPCEAINGIKKQRIIKTALLYISKQKLTDQDFRFDVMEILTHGEEVKINHIENAFDSSF